MIELLAYQSGNHIEAYKIKNMDSKILLFLALSTESPLVRHPALDPNLMI